MLCWVCIVNVRIRIKTSYNAQIGMEKSTRKRGGVALFCLGLKLNMNTASYTQNWTRIQFQFPMLILI